MTDSVQDRLETVTDRKLLNGALVLVTGATGYTGAWLTKKLVACRGKGLYPLIHVDDPTDIFNLGSSTELVGSSRQSYGMTR
jgi:hypothetical protein